MSVTRRALIVTNPGELGAENYCKGVYVDAKNYQRLLCTAYGGAWKQDEIVVRDRPTKALMQADVKSLAAYTYSMIMFSGHGWYSSVDSCNVITLRKGEELAANDLLGGATKRTVILDCCRKVYHEPVRVDETKISAFNATYRAAIGRVADPFRCREYFSQLIEQASGGVVTISSCSIDETAGDDEVKGGIYSSSLIKAADDWAEGEAERPYTAGINHSSIVSMHELGSEMTRRRSGGAQNPNITKPRSAPYYPFTVFA